MRAQAGPRKFGLMTGEGLFSTLIGYTLETKPYVLPYETDTGEGRFYKFKDL